MQALTIRQHIALPDVSRVMFNASKIGTPEVTSVPKVRVVRAKMFFSINPPNSGIFIMNWSNPIRPCLNLRIILPTSQQQIGNKNINQ